MDFLDTNQARLLVVGLAAALVAGTFFVFRGSRRVPGRTIRVVGVGGAGANALDAMKRAGMRGVEYVAVNTDLRALNRSSAGTKIAIGRSTTHGLGAGGDVAVGESAAREAAEAIGRALAGSDLVVIVAGLGGGTGSGAAPVVAELAREHGALTVAVVTKPFAFEGSRKAHLAQDAEAALVGLVDAVATIPNDQARVTMPAEVTVEDAFGAIDDALHRNVAEIVELVAVPGRINLDFADVRAVLRGGGAAAIGFGRAAGENRATAATREALAATLLESRIRGASSVLINVSGSRKLRLAELDDVAETILAAAGRDANLIFGVSLRPRLREDMQVAVIATGGPTTPRIAASTAAAASVDAGPVAVDSVEDDADVGEAVAPSENERFADDPDGWRPVWLRRATPGATPAPESSVRRSRSRKHRNRPGTERAPRPDESA